MPYRIIEHGRSFRLAHSDWMANLPAKRLLRASSVIRSVNGSARNSVEKIMAYSQPLMAPE